MKLSLNIIKRKTLPISWLLLSLFAVYPVAQHAWSGIVLCIGVDGHVKFEDGTKRDCATHLVNSASESHDEHVLPLIGPGGDLDCGLCLDIALRMSDVQKVTSEKAHISLEIPSRRVTLLLAQEHHRALYFNATPLETPTLPFFAPLRTVTLLI